MRNFFLLFFSCVALPEDPEFTDVMENITVPAGRNIKLACSVKNLGSYKVRIHHLQNYENQMKKKYLMNFKINWCSVGPENIHRWTDMSQEITHRCNPIGQIVLLNIKKHFVHLRRSLHFKVCLCVCCVKYYWCLTTTAGIRNVVVQRFYTHDFGFGIRLDLWFSFRNRSFSLSRSLSFCCLPSRKTNKQNIFFSHKMSKSKTQYSNKSLAIVFITISKRFDFHCQSLVWIFYVSLLSLPPPTFFFQYYYFI